MPKPAKNPALRGIITIMSVFTALLLVGFTLLHAKLQGEVMELVITSRGRIVIDKAMQIETPDDEEALQALSDAMKFDFEIGSRVHFFNASFEQFRPYAVIQIYDQDDQLIATESSGWDSKRIARLETKADENKRKNWSFFGSSTTRNTGLFISLWYDANHTELRTDNFTEQWAEENVPEDASEWIHEEGNTVSFSPELWNYYQSWQEAMEENYRNSGYLYYSFAAEGYPLFVTLQKMLPVYVLTAGLLLIAIKLVKRKLTAIPTTPTEEKECPTSPNPT